MEKYKENDFITVKSETSKYNGKCGQVVCYTNGKCKDIVKVNIDEKIINLKEDSLDFTSVYDVIRNMTDEELEKIILPKAIHKIEKSLSRTLTEEKEKKVFIKLGNITKMKSDAIVIPFSKKLFGGCKYFSHKEEKEFSKDLKKLGKIKLGEARITKGHKLPCDFVIHVAIPEYDFSFEKFIRLCYWNSLELAVANNLKTISFPMIGNNKKRHLLKPVAEIAIETVLEFQKTHDIKVCFVLSKKEDFKKYCNVYKKLKTI